jgi:iron complex transport system substrate-binding protein
MVGAGETQDEMTRLAGGINAAAEAGYKGFGNCSYEQLLKMDPDVLLVSSPKMVQLVLNEPMLSTLKAVKTKRIAVVPGNLYNSTTQFIVDGIETLAKQLHPDAFGAAPAENKDTPP